MIVAEYEYNGTPTTEVMTHSTKLDFAGQRQIMVMTMAGMADAYTLQVGKRTYTSEDGNTFKLLPMDENAAKPIGYEVFGDLDRLLTEPYTARLAEPASEQLDGQPTRHLLAEDTSLGNDLASSRFEVWLTTGDRPLIVKMLAEQTATNGSRTVITRFNRRFDQPVTIPRP